MSGKQETQAAEPLKSEEGNLFSKVFRSSLNQFEIPKLLAEREKQKQLEYQSREETDIGAIDGERLSDEELLEMKNLDVKFGYQNQNVSMTEEERLENERS